MIAPADEPRTTIVQAGAYGEHQIVVEVDGAPTPVDDRCWRCASRPAQRGGHRRPNAILYRSLLTQTRRMGERVSSNGAVTLSFD